MLNIGVIGAGGSGLVAMKELIDEGHQVTCFEKHPCEGGVFYYSHDKGGVYDSTLLTVSNYFMAFSSFPPQNKEERKLWTHKEYANYMRQFAEQFDLRKFIKFNSEIISVSVRDDEKITVQVSTNNKKEIYLFDAIAICTGTHQIPKYPDFINKNEFQGEILHSAFYKNAKPYEGKKVVCIGIGETAADVVHEISQVSASCTLSIRHYPAVISRYLDTGAGLYPNDAFTCRITQALPLSLANKSLIHYYAQEAKKNPCGESELLHNWLKNSENPSCQFATKNEIFMKDIASNKVNVNLSGIKQLSKDAVLFNDGTEIKTDVIMCNTGYQDDFSFIQDIPFKNVRELYKHCFHPEFGKKVAFIGWARPSVGGVPACSEMQARYFALLCSEKRTLPTKSELYNCIEKDKQTEEKRFYLSPNIYSLVSYGSYMDSMAKLIDCMPSKWLWLTNPKLFVKLFCGSLISYQYRLRGPHAMQKMAVNVITKLPIAFTPKERVMLFLIFIYYKIVNE